MTHRPGSYPAPFEVSVKLGLAQGDPVFHLMRGAPTVDEVSCRSVTLETIVGQ